MRATVVDLRYRMNEILKALGRNEDVTILYHGKPKGIIASADKKLSIQVRSHPFFGMRKGKGSVSEEMEILRGGRHRDL